MNIFRSVIIFVAISIVLLYLHKLNQNKDRISRDVIIKFIIGGSLLPIHPIMRGFDNPSIIFQMIGTISQYYSMFFVHIGALQLRKNRAYLSPFKSGIFWFVNIISPIMIFIIYNEHANLSSFSDDKPFIPSFTYYLFYWINYFTIFAISLSILITFNNETYNHQEAKKAIWWYLGPLCIVFLAIGTGFMVLNVSLSALGFDTYKSIFNNIYNFSKLFFVLFFAIFVVLPLIPRRFINLLVQSVEQMIDKRIQINKRLVSYMHDKIIPIVPGVRLDKSYSNIDDKLTEIADSWLMIWTHNNYKSYRMPQKKAQLLYNLSSSGMILTEFGNFQPPTKAVNEIRDAVRIAKHMLDLEKKND